MNLPELSSSETMIMKVIWEHEGDIPNAELVRQLKERCDKEYKPTTVSTFLNRLMGKGYISVIHKGKFAFIHPEIREEDYKKQVAKQETDFWFKGSASQYLAALFSTRGLTKEEVEEIRGLINDIRVED